MLEKCRHFELVFGFSFFGQVGACRTTKNAEILGHVPHHIADGHGMHGNELPSHAAWRQRWRSDSDRGAV